MSGTTTPVTSVTPLSSLPTQTTAPSSSDVLFGTFGGTVQFVEIGSLTEVILEPVSAQVQAATEQAAAASSYAALSSGNALTTLNQQKGQPNGLMPLSANGFFLLNGVEVMGVIGGQLIFRYPLPTTDPMVPNAWWNNGNTVCISAAT